MTRCLPSSTRALLVWLYGKTAGRFIIAMTRDEKLPPVKLPSDAELRAEPEYRATGEYP